MKLFIFIFTLAVILTSCKAKKGIVVTNTKAKTITAKKIAKKHLATNFKKNTIDAKLRVKFKNNTENQSFSVRLKIKKDEVIWLKGSKIISIFRAKITPTQVSYYSPYAKHYFEGDYALIKEFLGVDITFEELQNIFLGQAKIENKGRTYETAIIDHQYQLSPKEQAALFHQFFYINPLHFKLHKNVLVNNLKNRRLTIEYPEYLEKDNELFPKNTIITAQDNNKITRLDILVKSVVFNTPLSMPFTIPKGYKKIAF